MMSWFTVLSYHLIITWTVVTLTRSMCNNTMEQRCRGVDIRLRALVNETLSTRQTIYCRSRTFYHSHPNGTIQNITTNSSKYQISGVKLTIQFDIVSRSDEGVYGCNPQDQNTDMLCLFVYAKAVFASSEDVQLNLTAAADGGTVRFDATVVHKPSGTSRCRQEVKYVFLDKLHTNRLLTYDVTEDEVKYNPTGRVNLTVGSSGLEFVLTLSNNDSESMAGRYNVTVETKDPSGGGCLKIQKTFHLNVHRVPDATTTPSGTPTSYSENSSPTTLYSVTDPSSSILPTTTHKETGSPTEINDPKLDVRNIMFGIIGGLVVAVVMISIVIALSILVTRYLQRKFTIMKSAGLSSFPPNNVSIPVSESSSESDSDRQFTRTVEAVCNRDSAQGGDLLQPHLVTSLPPINDKSSVLDLNVHLSSTGNSQYVTVVVL